MYPIQTVGSSCPTFLGKIRRRKKRMFPSILRHSWHPLESFHHVVRAIEKYLFFDVAIFRRNQVSPPPCLFKSKFHHLPGKRYMIMKGSPKEKIHATEIKNPLSHTSSPSAISDKNFEQASRKSLCMQRVWWENRTTNLEMKKIHPTRLHLLLFPKGT